MLLGAGLAMAAGAPKHELVTSLEGNIVGVVPNTGGLLRFPNDQQMELRTGLATVAVPYANVAKAKLGASREQSDNSPLYKVWTLHKRILKPQVQKLTVDFKNADGEQKSMTVEMEKSAAMHLVNTIHRANGDADTGIKVEQAAAGPDAWWGDSMWKTTRNKESWSKPGESKPGEFKPGEQTEKK